MVASHRMYSVNGTRDKWILKRCSMIACSIQGEPGRFSIGRFPCSPSIGESGTKMQWFTLSA